MHITASLLASQDADWIPKIAGLRRQLGAPRNPELLPPQFVLATLRGIGGQVIQWHVQDTLVAVGLRLPAMDRNGTVYHLIRCHSTGCGPGLSRASLHQACRALWDTGRILIYDAESDPIWPVPPVLATINDVDYARPTVRDARAIRHLQAEIWQAADDNLYPGYIHEPAFQAVFSLVARQQEKVLGFLLGFLHDGPLPPLPAQWPPGSGPMPALESQALGIHPAHRKQNIAFHLKRVQAQEMYRQGIAHIQWVTDPLQYRNARLNFGRLGAVSCQLLPDHLPFRNALNRVQTSRLRMIWPVASALVQNALAAGVAAPPLDLGSRTDVGFVHDRLEHIQWHLDTPWLAVEIPRNWSHMQRTEQTLAQRWRDTTDRILAHYLGPAEGQYMITHTGFRRDRIYLVAERVCAALVARYRAHSGP